MFTENMAMSKAKRRAAAIKAARTRKRNAAEKAKKNRSQKEKA